jgi:sugar phosphate isomerase/epimerase
MLLGYNTNGLCHHDPVAALELLAEIGYQSVAITLDHHCLAPRTAWGKQQLPLMAEALSRLGLRHVLETGARFLLDRNVKHEPTLMSATAAARQRRIEFYCDAIELAAELQSDCVSLWSGVLRESLSEEQAFERLASGLGPVLEYAAKYNVAIGFEPEPGMFIDTMVRYERLLDLVDAPHFLLTLDLGHLHCLGELPIAEHIARHAARLVNIHVEDMCKGVHEHLPLGTGEMDFPPIFAALRAANYQGGVHVELSRHSHDGPRYAHESFRFLQPWML